MREFAIQRRSGRDERLDFLEAALRREIRSPCCGRGIAAKSVPTGFGAGRQPCNKARRTQQFSVRGSLNRTAARGNHEAVALAKIGERSGFAISEARFTFGNEYLGDGLPGDGFEVFVGVGEGPTELVREELPDGGFARTAIADEDDTFGIHIDNRFSPLAA